MPADAPTPGVTQDLISHGIVYVWSRQTWFTVARGSIVVMVALSTDALEPRDGVPAVRTVAITVVRVVSTLIHVFTLLATAFITFNARTVEGSIQIRTLCILVAVVSFISALIIIWRAQNSCRICWIKIIFTITNSIISYETPIIQAKIALVGSRHSRNVRHQPSGHTRNNNAFITSKRRRWRRLDAIKTLSLRHYCVMCPLGGRIAWCYRCYR